MKIAVLGYSGSGKSTLAQDLGKTYGIPVLHLDKIQFLPGWKERDKEESIALTREFMKQDFWVIDGNYTSLLQKERLEQADQIIYMEFGRIPCLIRAYKRYFKYRNQTRESVAEGCKEKMDREFVWWILYKGRVKKKRRRYHEMIQMYRDKTVVLKNQRQLDAFRKTLNQEIH